MIVLVDTSVWVDHLRRGDAKLSAALEAGEVHMHPFVVGELACGNLKARAQVLNLLQALPPVSAATDREALFFMERHALMGRGIGFIDVHLLTSAQLSGGQLWTRDKKLHAVASELGLGYSETKH